MSESLKLTDRELFSLFNKSEDEIRWMASAESSEYLNRVIYLTHRMQQEMR